MRTDFGRTWQLGDWPNVPSEWQILNKYCWW